MVANIPQDSGLLMFHNLMNGVKHNRIVCSQQKCPKHQTELVTIDKLKQK